uniref:SGNH hydrolase-type esterase domain-containing protein n=1 Tax=Compsopogon caeruleus TaxID=31354 RepID=A0A7S1XHK2_9RHOD
MKVRKLFGVIGLSLVSVAGVQAAVLSVTYQSPPDAPGPRQGVERTTRGHPTATHARRQVTWFRDTLHRWKDEYPGRVPSVVVSESAGTSCACVPETPTSKKIIFVGDSLVTGVGCTETPMLPRAVAKALAEHWKADVAWSAVGLTGGDVRTLHAELVPLVRDEVLAAKRDNQKIEMVVIICGVNDWKRVLSFRTAAMFRRDLAELVDSVRDVVGPDTMIVLPALPGVNVAPRFREPLRTVFTWISDTWDSEKRTVSEQFSRVKFIARPSGWDFEGGVRRYFSNLDGIHPSDFGYNQWGAYIAEQVIGGSSSGKVPWDTPDEDSRLFPQFDQFASSR